MSTLNKSLIAALLTTLSVFLSSGYNFSLSFLKSPNVGHRLQTTSLLHGHLALSESVEEIGHDLAWANSSVQQVWGLGIPLWQSLWSFLPYLIGNCLLPERLIFFLSLAGFYWYLLRKGIIWAQDDPPMAYCAVLIWSLFPPFVGLIRSRFLIYEEVVAYGFIVMSMQALCLMSLAETWNTKTWVLCCILAAVGPLVRPTLGVSTLVACLLGGWIGYRRKCRVWVLCCGIAIVFTGCAALWLTNLIRFGDGFEFGHTINLQSVALTGSLYSTRFGSPFDSASWIEVLVEVVGMMFFPLKQNGNDHYETGLFLGQSNIPRWRESYLQVFDASSVAIVVMASIIWGLRRSGNPSNGDIFASRGRVLMLWGIMTFGPLMLFYSRVPVIASRYLLDLAAPLAACLVASWWIIIRQMRRLGPIAAMVWLVCELFSSYSLYGPPLPDRQDSSPEIIRPRLVAVPVSCSYDSPQAVKATGIEYNGSGWDMETGTAAAVCIFWVTSPTRIEVDLTWRGSSWEQTAAETALNAKLGRQLLRREQKFKDGNKLTVAFSPAPDQKPQMGLQVVFLCLAPVEKFNAVDSGWKIEAFRWVED